MAREQKQQLMSKATGKTATPRSVINLVRQRGNQRVHVKFVARFLASQPFNYPIAESSRCVRAGRTDAERLASLSALFPARKTEHVLILRPELTL